MSWFILIASLATIKISGEISPYIKNTWANGEYENVQHYNVCLKINEYRTYGRNESIRMPLGIKLAWKSTYVDGLRQRNTTLSQFCSLLKTCVCICTPRECTSVLYYTCVVHIKKYMVLLCNPIFWWCQYLYLLPPLNVVYVQLYRAQLMMCNSAGACALTLMF